MSVEARRTALTDACRPGYWFITHERGDDIGVVQVPVFQMWVN